MLINLITPLMLATAPQLADSSIAIYDHQSQSAGKSHLAKKEQIAYSSTRTYDWQGNPNDSDFD